MTRIVGDGGEIVYEREEDLLFTRFDEIKGFMSLANEKYLKLPLKIGMPLGVRDRDLRHVLTLGEYLTRDNALHYRKRSMTAGDMSDILDMDRSHVYAMLRRLSELEILTRYDTVYFFNPMYITINRYITPLCYRAWETFLREHLSQWAIDRFEKIAPKKEDKA